MSYCTKCGKENADTAKFCTKCGNTLITIQQPVQSKKNFITIIIIVFVMIAVVACYFTFFNKKSKPGNIAITTTATDTTVVRKPELFVPKSSYTIPGELLFTGKRENGVYPGPMYPKFYPIGWSKEGKFAYAEEPVDESCGCYFLNIYIQDMYSDKMVWNWSQEITQEQGYNEKKGNAYYLKKVWDENNSILSQKLNEYHVEPLTFNNLEKLPLIIKNNQFTFSLNNNSFYSNDFGQNMLVSSSISLLVNGSFKKKVFIAKYAKNMPETGTSNFSTTISNNILGYLKNPFENRIALFYITERRGWEGPPNVISLQMIGCDLSNVGMY